jgi:hypothetical protein
LLSLLTIAAQVGPQAASAADNSADSDGLGGGPQYDGAHVYLWPADMEPFIKGCIATFGGRARDIGPVDPFGFSRPWPFRCEDPLL